MKKPVFFLLILLILAGAARGAQTEFRKNPAVSGIMPEKPLRMELKRDVQGRYSWSIQGTNVNQMIREDRKFRAYIEKLEKKDR